MKMNIDVEIVPFRVPLYVRSIIPDDMGGADNNYIGRRKYLLEELSPEILERLCAEFRVNVFKAAKKEDAIGITKGFNTTGEKWETRV